MKNSEEMARSVLTRAKEEKEKQSRIRKGIIGTAAVLCVAALVALGSAEFWLPQSDTPALSTDGIVQNTSKSRLSVFSVSAAEYKTMINEVNIPQGIIRVRDVSDNNEVEKVFIRREILEEGEILGEKARFSSRQLWEDDDAMVMMAYAERLMVFPDDFEEVADFLVTAKNSSAFCIANPDRNLNSGEFERGIEIEWYLSQTEIDMLCADPDTKLSAFEDVITLTVKFKDGSTELVIIDVDVDDEGTVYMTHRGS